MLSPRSPECSPLSRVEAGAGPTWGSLGSLLEPQLKQWQHRPALWEGLAVMEVVAVTHGQPCLDSVCCRGLWFLPEQTSHKPWQGH